MSKFKAGDWVICPDEKTIAKVEHDSFIVLSEKIAKNYKLWQPKQYEWVWFYSEEYPMSYILAKFERFEDGLYWAHTQFSDEIDGFPCCEPFIDKLPSFIKKDK